MYPASWTTIRSALAGFAGPDDLFGGFDLGVRLQTPTRLAPFVGLGTFHGYSSSSEPAANDWRDNDGDGFVDELGEREKSLEGWLSSIYPEVGAHVWINGTMRVTGYGRYLITTEGRSHDDWLVGLQLALFQR